MSKYRNRKITVDGIEFDSKKEAERYQQLKIYQRAGLISDLRLQVPFELIPAQYEDSPEVYVRNTSAHKKGEHKKKLVEKAVVYRADFVYIDDGETVVEDVKGMKTREYIIKRKLMLKVHGIKVREV